MPRSRGGGQAAAKRNDLTPERSPSTTANRDPKGGAFLAGLAAAEKAAATADVSTLPRAHRTRFAPHPENPDHRHLSKEELASLISDIRRDGDIFHPLLVATRAAVVKAAPELDETIDKAAEWVVLDGHRRWGASGFAGIDELPYLVRDDLADPRSVTLLRLRSVIQREALSPIEEARSFRLLATREKMSQRDIAAASGVSQSYVSKAVALLGLPEAAQEAITAGDRSANELRPLLDLPDGEREAVYHSATKQPDGANGVAASIAAAARRRVAELDREKVVVKARADVESRGFEVIDPAHEFGAHELAHRLTEDEATDANREIRGAHVDSTGRVTYYARTVAERSPSEEQSSPTTKKSKIARTTDGGGVADSSGISEAESAAATRREQEQAEAKEMARERLAAAEAAHTARCEAIRRMVGEAAKLSPSVLLDVLSDSLLMWDRVEWTDYSDGADLAAELTELVDESVEGRSRSETHRSALALALCAAEVRAHDVRAIDDPYPPEVRRYVSRLIELGYYAATDYDTERLALTGTSAPA